MAQIGRALKRALLVAMPTPVRNRVMAASPAFRKSAPAGQEFVFNEYSGDVKVNINTRFAIERMMWSQQYETALMRFLDKNARPGWVCLDVGANVGAVALPLAKAVGSEGKVYGFEPGVPNLERLRANLALNPELSARVEVFPVGVGDQPGELGWIEEAGNPGNAMLGSEGSHRVPVITLDDWMFERAIERVDFVKIDVEGMEFKVLAGAKNLMQKFHPTLYFETKARWETKAPTLTTKKLHPVLHFEALHRFTGQHDGGNFSMIETLLTKECGYKLHKFDPDGNLHPVGAGEWADYTIAVFDGGK